MFDFVLPETLKEFTMTHKRALFMLFWGAQVSVACAFVFYSLRKCAASNLSMNCRAVPLSLFYGLRFSYLSLYDVIILTGFVCGLFVYAFLIIDNANLSHFDQSHITSGAMHGKLWMQINPGNGRFSPLIHQEYLLIALFADQAWQYYSIAAGLLLLVVCLCVAIIPFKALGDRLLLVAAFVFSTGFAIPVAGLIYAEINIIIALCAFLCCAYIYNQPTQLQTHLRRAFVASAGMIVCAAYLIYVKEPMFLALGGYAFLAIVQKTCLSGPASSVITATGGLRQRVFCLSNEIAIGFLASVYACVYVFYILLQTKNRYGSEVAMGPLLTVMGSLQGSPFVPILIATIIWRCVAIMRGSCERDLVLDSLAIAFLFVYAVYIYLGLVTPYYYLPIGFMGLVLFAKTAAVISGKILFRVCLAILCATILISSWQGFFQFFRDRELYMQSRRFVVEALEEVLARTQNSDDVRIYYLERFRGYDVGQFVAFLNHSLTEKKFVIIKDSQRASQRDFTGIPVVPVMWDNKNIVSIDDVRALAYATGIAPRPGDVFIALPSGDGANIEIDNSVQRAEVGDSKVFTLTSELRDVKKWANEWLDLKGRSERRSYVVVF